MTTPANPSTEAPACGSCPHAAHLGPCTRRNGQTANPCPCLRGTLPRPRVTETPRFSAFLRGDLFATDEAEPQPIEAPARGCRRTIRMAAPNWPIRCGAFAGDGIEYCSADCRVGVPYAPPIERCSCPEALRYRAALEAICEGAAVGYENAGEVRSATALNHIAIVARRALALKPEGDE